MFLCWEKLLDEHIPVVGDSREEAEVAMACSSRPSLRLSVGKGKERINKND